MATSRRSFIQLVGLNGLAVAAAGCATTRPARRPAVTPQDAPPLGAPGTRSSVLRLSSNENSAGPGAKVLTAMQDSFDVANRYAFRLPSDLTDALAASLGVQPSQVTLGCGSSEILDVAAAAFLGPGRALVTGQPTFELLSGRAQMWGAQVVDVPVDAELRLDLGQMAQKRRWCRTDLHLQSEQPDRHRSWRVRHRGVRHGGASDRAEGDHPHRRGVPRVRRAPRLQDRDTARSGQPTRRRVADVLEDLRDGRTAGWLRGGTAGDAGRDEPLPRRRPPELSERPSGADCACRPGVAWPRCVPAITPRAR